MAHGLLYILLAAAAGRLPAADGSVELLPPLDGPADAVVTFTAHSYVVADVDERQVRARLRPDDPGAATHVAFIAWLAEHLGCQAGQLDVVLAATALDGPPPLDLAPRDDLGHHHRVARAGRYRTGLRAYAPPWTPQRGPRAHASGVLVIGRGLAGRWEAAFEVEPAHRGQGLGRALALSARHLAPAGEPVFVQVSPGNAASLRAVLAAGYRPIGSEVLLPRRR